MESIEEGCAARRLQALSVDDAAAGDSPWGHLRRRCGCVDRGTPAISPGRYRERRRADGRRSHDAATRNEEGRRVKDAATETTAAARTSAAPASVETKPTGESVKAMALTTVTGCLEREEETFWLKEASGSNAPTSRSWRSGFLKKRPPWIKLVDAANALKLPRHVGQRVAATGTLMNREIRASSLLRVAGSCS